MARSPRTQFRRGSSAEWADPATPVLAAGEPGYDTDTGVHKIGDGTTAWPDLESPVGTQRSLRVEGDDPNEPAVVIVSAVGQTGTVWEIRRGTDDLLLASFDRYGSLYLGSDLNIESAIHGTEIEATDGFYGDLYIEVAPQAWVSVLDLTVPAPSPGQQTTFQTYLDLPAPTEAETTAQVQAITQLLLGTTP